jgi:hypothetical protein
MDALEHAPDAAARAEAAQRYHARYDWATFCGKLNLAGMGLMVMPQDVCQLQGLTELDLSDNCFVCPPGALRERFPNLQKVRLKGNPGCETEAIPAELSDGCSLVALQAHLRVLERSRESWPNVKVTFSGSPSAHVIKTVKKLSGGLAFGSVGSDECSENVFVDEWQVADQCSILAFVHAGGAGDFGASAAREEFFSHRSVHVLVLSSFISDPQEGEVAEIRKRLDLLGCNKLRRVFFFLFFVFFLFLFKDILPLR